MLDKSKVGRLHLKGYNSTEIAEILSVKSSTVRKCISRNFSEMKAEHQIARTRKETIERSLNKEVNSYIGSAAMVRANPSVFISNSKGDLVRKKGDGFVFTNDMPKVLRNEELREYKKTFKKKVKK